MVAERAASYGELLDLEAIRTLRAQRQLREFVKQAWPVVEPGRELILGFYVDAISDHLQAVADGDIKRLVITIPPGFLKSTIVSVLFPAWLWIDRSSLRFLTTSHDSDLAMRDAVRSRRVMTSDWYQDRWGDRFAMTTDQNVKTRYENDNTGHRISLGTGSGITGKRGDMIICDDPHDAEDVWSDNAREATIRWWNEAVPSRLNDPKTGAKIVIQQRLHERDLAGEVISQGYEHLNLPMEYEPTVHVTAIGWADPRTEPGTVLDPIRYGPDEVAEKRKELGSQAYAAQYQQKPTPPEGAIIKRHWLNQYAQRPPTAPLTIQSWDTAFKDGADNDYSVCSTFAYGPNGAYLLDVYRDRIQYPDLERMAVQQRNRWRPAAVLIEDKASGQSLIQSLRRNTDVPVISIPVRKDKVQRVNEVSPGIEAGRLLLPVSAPWLDDVILELTTFPNAAHDDVVDSISQALAWLFNRDLDDRHTGHSWLPDDTDDDEDDPAWLN